jgi:hypothetical protein
MKNESGSASFGTALKVAACLLIGFGLLVIWRGRSRRDLRSVADAGMEVPTNETSAQAEDMDDPPAERRSDGASHNPVRVQPFHGQYCASVGPPGWAVTSENPQREAFGADLASGDGMAYAGYSIFSCGPMAPLGFETPGRAVASVLTGFGTVSVQFRNRRQVGPNVFLLEYQSPTNHGVAFYQVIPAPGVGYMIVMRMAGTGNARGLWENRASEAMAVARSLRCQVPSVPAAADPPGLNAKSESRAENNDESDTLYNTWLEREYYHNPQNGENYWVSPSENYSNTGPDGPGYYATFGNSLIKLDPGYSQ